MLRTASILAAIVWSLAIPGEARARYNGDLNLFVGQKWFQQTDWAPVAEQPQLGLMFSFGEERAPVHFSVDVFWSKDEEDFVDPILGPGRKVGSSLEYAIGVRKTWRNAVTRPHVGGGADIVTARRDTVTPAGTDHREDRGYGAWIEVGLSWRLARHLNLGIDARYTRVDVDLGTQYVMDDAPAGGFHAGLLLGYGW